MVHSGGAIGDGDKEAAEAAKKSMGAATGSADTSSSGGSSSGGSSSGDSSSGDSSSGNDNGGNRSGLLYVWDGIEALARCSIHAMCALSCSGVSSCGPYTHPFQSVCKINAVISLVRLSLSLSLSGCLSLYLSLSLSLSLYLSLSFLLSLFLALALPPPCFLPRGLRQNSVLKRLSLSRVRLCGIGMTAQGTRYPERDCAGIQLLVSERRARVASFVPRITCARCVAYRVCAGKVCVTLSNECLCM